MSVKYGSQLQKLLTKKVKKIRSELRTESTDTARELASWLTVAVREWSHKPTFSGKVVISADLTEITVKIAGTNKLIFFYVDKGTGKWGPKKREYPIVPKTPGGMLKFQSGYSARSAPGAKIGQGTGEHFGAWTSMKEVMHPGIEPRGFTKTVVEDLSPDFFTRIEDAIGRAVTA